MGTSNSSNPRDYDLSAAKAKLREAFQDLTQQEIESALARSRGPYDHGGVHRAIEMDDGSSLHVSFDPSCESLDEFVDEAAPKLRRILRKRALLEKAESVEQETRTGLLGRLRKAIRELGQKARPEHVIKKAHVANKPGRELLRELQSAGEYDGFARDKPARYES